MAVASLHVQIIGTIASCGPQNADTAVLLSADMMSRYFSLISAHDSDKCLLVCNSWPSSLTLVSGVEGEVLTWAGQTCCLSCQ